MLDTGRREIFGHQSLFYKEDQENLSSLSSQNSSLQQTDIGNHSIDHRILKLFIKITCKGDLHLLENYYILLRYQKVKYILSLCNINTAAT